MAASVVYNTLFNLVQTAFSGTYAVHNWEDIEQQLEQGTVPFLVLEEISSTDDIVAIGTPTANLFRAEGEITVHIFIPSSGGLSLARTIGDALRDAIRYKYFNPATNVYVRTETPGQPEPGIVNDGLWHSALVSMPYVHEYLAATA